MRFRSVCILVLVAGAALLGSAGGFTTLAGEIGPVIQLTYGGPRDGVMPSSVVFGASGTDSVPLGFLWRSHKRGFDYTGEVTGLIHFVSLDPGKLEDLDRALTEVSPQLQGLKKLGKGRWVSLVQLTPRKRGYRVRQYFLDVNGWKVVWGVFREAMRGDADLQTALDRFTGQAGLPVPEK